MAGDRDGLRRFAAPVALLALVTIAVVLIHNGLSNGSSTSSSTPPPTATGPGATTAASTKTAAVSTATAPATAEYYVVQSGDTFGSIAARYGTTVAAIESLNPGVSSTSLTVGEKIRVK